MSEGFDKLKNIGIQKIHENTHISRVHIEAILSEDFSDMHKVQLLGFVSILEREYHLDLSELKDNALTYFEELHAGEEENRKVFVVPKRKKNLTPIYISVAIIIFAIIVFISMNSNSDDQKVKEFDNQIIEKVSQDIDNIKADENISEAVVDENLSTVEEEVQEVTPEIKQEPKNEVKSLKIEPKVRVWLGYIDLENYKRHQKTFKDTLELDPSKDWLLAFGHGHLNIEVDGVIKKYKSKRNIRFSYINGELKEISLEEFKTLNKGNRW
jgi:hypothetical protein